MTSLDFLYIALGGGFILLVIFLCVMILNLTLVLRDVTKITANIRGITDRIYDAVIEPLKTLSEITAKFGIIHEMVEKIRSKINATEGEDEARADGGGSADQDLEGQNEESPRKKRGFFSVKKLRK